MAIDTQGMITVAEAARRMNRSIEQVRRKLREGTLRGQRIGNQWFVEEDATLGTDRPARPLLSDEQIDRIKKLRREINEYNRKQGHPPFDVLDMIRRHRDGD